MATIATATPHTTRPGHAIRTAKPGLFIPSFSLWQREIVRFYRQRARVVGVIASPLLFWVAFGAGFSHSFSSGNTGASGHAFGYFFPGSIVLIVLFTAIFSMMSLIQDRNEGFLLTVIASPVSRSAIVLQGARWRHPRRHPGPHLSVLHAARRRPSQLPRSRSRRRRHPARQL